MSKLRCKNSKWLFSILLVIFLVKYSDAESATNKIDSDSFDFEGMKNGFFITDSDSTNLSQDVQCDKKLNEIQNGLDARGTWALKRNLDFHSAFFIIYEV